MKKIPALLFACLVCTAVAMSQTHYVPNVMVSTFAGAPYPYDRDEQGDLASFLTPMGVVTDAAGNCFVVDYLNNKIKKITPGGLVTTLAGSGVAGNTDGQGTAATFQSPLGIAMDASGTLYVAGAGQTIRKITPGGLVTTLAGSGVAGHADGQGTAASFYSPNALAVDASGTVYVVDAVNQKIRKITPGGLVSTFAGSGTAGYADGQGTAASFYSPCGIALDAAGNLYICDAGNNRIRKITPGGLVSTIAGSGTAGNIEGVGTAALFNTPAGIAIDAQNNLYIVDSGNNRIRKIAPDATVTSFAGAGAIGKADGQGAAASFNNPFGIALDASGNLYVSDRNNNEIRKITPGGLVSTLAGSEASKRLDGQGTLARFYNPYDMVFDASGNMYVSDDANFEIRKITPGGLVTTFAGSGASGTANGQGAAAMFNYPSGLAMDASGNLYVADKNNNQIRKITPAGVVSVYAGSGLYGSTEGAAAGARFYYPRDIVLDASGNMYVSDTYNNKIRLITPGGTVSTFAGSGVAGSLDGQGTAARFNSPGSITIDASGNLYVLDYNKIRKITPGGLVSTLAGADTYGSADAVGTAARFNGPSGISVDASGNLYVADPGNSTIRMISPDGTVRTLAGSAPTYGNVDGAGTVALFSYPIGTAVDANGNVFIADYANSEIRKITIGGVTTAIAAGQETSLLSVYPNPAKDVLTVQLPEDVSGIAVVFDTQGNVVLTQAISGSEGKLSVAGLPNGMYTLKIRSGKNTYVSPVLILK